MHPVRLVVFQQNMGFLPGPFYKGTEREAAIAGLVAGVRALQPDVVGLSECFDNSDRAALIEGLEDLYPHWLEGPLEPDFNQDGGLVLMSRHEPSARGQSVYRSWEAEDGVTDKGILHMRIQPPAFPAPIDLFLSHMQNPTPDFGSDDDAQEALEDQQRHLRAYVEACGHISRPALAFGDLNVDGFDEPLYVRMMENLGGPVDVWTIADERTFNGRQGDWVGVTFDRERCFKEGEEPLPADDPARGVRGPRLDYALDWSTSRRWKARYSKADVVLLESSPGKQVSDHYGLTVELDELVPPERWMERPFHRITVILEGFHCLKETAGIGRDEVRFGLSCGSQAGTFEGAEPEKGWVRSEQVDRVKSGSTHTFAEPPTLELREDPGEFVEIRVHGWEIDKVVDDKLGPEILRLDRADLAWLRHETDHQRFHLFATPLLTGRWGEYVPRLRIEVD